MEGLDLKSLFILSRIKIEIIVLGINFSCILTNYRVFQKPEFVNQIIIRMLITYIVLELVVGCLLNILCKD